MELAQSTPHSAWLQVSAQLVSILIFPRITGWMQALALVCATQVLCTHSCPGGKAPILLSGDTEVQRGVNNWATSAYLGGPRLSSELLLFAFLAQLIDLL